MTPIKKWWMAVADRYQRSAGDAAPQGKYIEKQPRTFAWTEHQAITNSTGPRKELMNEKSSADRQSQHNSEQGFEVTGIGP